MRAFSEFGNTARLSKYPFSDSSSMTASGGYRLPDDFLVDASICVRSSGVPYLSSLSKGVGSFSVDGVLVATFSYSGTGPADVVSADSGKVCGVVVLGPSATGFESLSFRSSAARLCPSCFCSFFREAPVMSLSDGNVRLRGNVRIRGENGVYVTQVGENKLKIDVIGNPETPETCLEPVRRLVVVARDCPAVAGVPLQYPGTDEGFVQGVIALRSPLGADDVCGRKERYFDVNGYAEISCSCEPPSFEPPCLEDTETSVVYPANGNIDLAPFFSRLEESPSPVMVEVRKNGFGSVSTLSSSDSKSLAALANSGTVVLKFKGK